MAWFPSVPDLIEHWIEICMGFPHCFIPAKRPMLLNTRAWLQTQQNGDAIDQMSLLWRGASPLLVGNNHTNLVLLVPCLTWHGNTFPRDSLLERPIYTSEPEVGKTTHIHGLMKGCHLSIVSFVHAFVFLPMEYFVEIMNTYSGVWICWLQELQQVLSFISLADLRLSIHTCQMIWFHGGKTCTMASIWYWD
jgi:hypothetical protein